MSDDEDWEARVAALWERLDDMEPAAFRAAVDALAGERGEDDAAGLFERACANDSTGETAVAIPLYRAAMDQGLTGLRRRRAAIQMASSLRATGNAEASVAILREERARTSDDLDDALCAVLALALADSGRAREGVGLAVEALARHLPRYNRSMANYGRALQADTGA